MEQNNLKLAVLIDADNISYKYLRTLFDEIAQYGIAYVKRVYGDWSSALLNPPYITILHPELIQGQRSTTYYKAMQ